MRSDPSPCPRCGSPFYTATFAGRWERREWIEPSGGPLLYVCSNGCTGRSIAAALGVRLPGPEDARPAAPLPRPATRREPDGPRVVPELPVAS